MSGEKDMAARITEGRIRHGVGSSEDFPGNVCHLVSPIVGHLRLRERDGEALTDLAHIIDRLSLVLDMARQEATPEPSETTDPTAGEREVEWECRPCLALKGSDCICATPDVADEQGEMALRDHRGAAGASESENEERR